MKKFYVVFCSLFLIITNLNAQNCLPEGITFSTQTAIDNFQIDYPGCTGIAGDVIINEDYGSGDYITNLGGLNVLTSVGGNLVIKSTSSLNNLVGLEGLLNIEGDFILGGWVRSEAHFNVWDPVGNTALTSLNGLENLEAIGGSFKIFYNDALVNFDGLESLSSVGGDFILGDWKYCEWDDADYYNYAGNLVLNSLSGLENLTQIGGSFEITKNNSIINLDGLDGLLTIGGDLKIWGNESLETLAGIETLTSVGGGLFLGNSYKRWFNGMGEQPDAFGFDIIGNTSLTSLSALSNLTFLGGDLFILYNDVLNNLDGLESLNSINGTIKIFGNAGLNSLSGLDGITSINGDFILGDWKLVSEWYPFKQYYKEYGNPLLTDLSDLSSLNTVGGDFSITCNNSLINFEGLENLESVGGTLKIFGNDALQNLTGFDGLASIGGDFILGDSHIWKSGWDGIDWVDTGEDLLGNALISLSKLSNLNSIGGDLLIRYNDALTSLNGLNNIEPTSISNLKIYGNSTLFSCDIQSICEYLVSPNGAVEIYDNADGCNSQSEVEAACDESVLPFFEGWELSNGTTMNSGNIYSGNSYTWDFETNLPGKGRVSWGTNAMQAHSGSGALSMDKDFPTSSYSINSAILTLDLSDYTLSKGIELSFWWTDHSDEEHPNDKVWIRGSETDEWVEAYDINPTAFRNNRYNFSEIIDIDQLLATAVPSQTISETFQVKFGQEDNGPLPYDGISFDDILIVDASFEPAVLPIVEDWENYTGNISSSGFMVIQPTYGWCFETNIPGKGRANWGTNAYLTHGGSGAITLDKDFPTSSYTINASVLTINMVNYIGSTDLELSFWWTDHGDEEHPNDKVWIRGNEDDEWIVAYDINPAAFRNNLYNFSEIIDIDQLLATATPAQSVSETFQVKFGQEDNGPIPNDGISFDDIVVQETPPLPGHHSNSGDVSSSQNKNIIELISYPNPFIGASTIQFDLDETNYTKLTVNNSLGVEVATLFDGQAEGKRVYKVEFDGSNLPSGIYFYHLQTSDGVNAVKKMHLVK